MLLSDSQLSCTARRSHTPMIPNALGNIWRNTPNNAQRIPLRISRCVSSIQRQDSFIRDISGDEVAEGHLNGQIDIAPSNWQERSDIDRLRLDGFRTSLQSPKLSFKHYDDVMMTPKKRPCPRPYRLIKPVILRLP